MAEVFEIYVKTHFSAAHRLRGYPGDCACVQGHNWIIEVFVQCRKLNDIGIGIDFRDVKQATKEVLSVMDHRDLNELPAFAEENPTSENIAKFVYQELRKRIDGDRVKVSRVKVSETPGAGALYWEE
jgi:6-pyruvoyltetrahydropterin/6-carboxytetrahydropterin synthase